MANLPRNVWTTCPENRARSVVAPDEYKICNGEHGAVLAIVKGQIAIADVIKAAKCAKLKKFEVWFKTPLSGYKFYLNTVDFPVKMDVWLVPVSAPIRRTGTKVFHLCESTSTPPARMPLVMAKPKKIVQVKLAKSARVALIKILKQVISELEE